jgi:DNA-directed RNA polymerase specialized sigma24 family protein
VLEHHRRGRARAASVDPGVLSELDRRYDDLARIPGDSFRAKAERIAECLRRLPEPMRAAVELVYVRDMLMSAAAGALDATEEAIKKRVQRARQLLGECVRSAEVRA